MAGMMHLMPVKIKSLMTYTKLEPWLISLMVLVLIFGSIYDFLLKS